MKFQRPVKTDFHASVYFATDVAKNALKDAEKKIPERVRITYVRVSMEKKNTNSTLRRIQTCKIFVHELQRKISRHRKKLQYINKSDKY